MNCKPAIIAGSGLLNLPDFKIHQKHLVDTPWGKPSSPVYAGAWQGVEVLFMTRHGDKHSIAPHKVNYRANIAALAQLGASHLFAYNAVGGMGDYGTAGSLVIPDQIIDYTWGREHTFYDGGDTLDHIDFTQPYDESLRQILLSSAKNAAIALQTQGVYGATQGPRLESAAEIKRMVRDGCNVVGMTGMPEAALAREKNLPYACLALVVNAAAGEGSENITMADIERVVSERMPSVCDVLSGACALVSA